MLSQLDGAESYDRARGVFVAVGTAPTPIPPSGWLPLVLGDSEPDGVEVAEELLGLLLRAYNQTIDALERRDFVSVCPAADDVAAVEQWSAGYVEAAELDDEWMEDEDTLPVLACLQVLAGELAPEEMRDETDTRFADEQEWLQFQRESLPTLVDVVYDYWQTRLRAAQVDAQIEAMAEREPPVGRNDPCPCGSGKKYKNCCMS